MSYRELGRELEEISCSICCGIGEKPKASRGEQVAGKARTAPNIGRGEESRLNLNKGIYYTSYVWRRALIQRKKSVSGRPKRATGWLQWQAPQLRNPALPSSSSSSSSHSQPMPHALDLLGNSFECSWWDYQSEPSTKRSPTMTSADGKVTAALTDRIQLLRIAITAATKRS